MSDRPRSRRRTLPRLLLAALAAVLVCAAPALAVPVVDGEFALPDQPRQLTLGPDGNVWVALGSATRAIAKVAPDGTVTTYTTPAIANPQGIAAGPDGTLWVTQSGGVASFLPADPGAARAFPIGAPYDPRGIVLGPDGNMWAASNDELIQIRASDGSVVRRFRPTGLVGARNVARGGDGSLYVADFGGAQIVGMTPAGASTLYPTGGGPQDVAAGLGTQLAYTNQGTVPHTLGRLTAGVTTVLRTEVPNTDPFGIAFGLDQAYWTANFLSGDLTRLAADGTVTTLGGISAGAGPRYIAAGAGGTLWVGLEVSRRVARVSGLEAPRADPPRVDPPRTDPPRSDPPRRTDPIVVGASRLYAISFPRSIRKGATVTVRATASTPLTAVVIVQRRLAGKRSGGRCVAPRPSLRRARSCVRLGRRTLIERRFAAGPVTIRFGSRLAVGSYRVSVQGGTTAPKVQTLTVLRPRRRRG